MEKSANKRWKESGSTLTFKEWIDRENKKNNSFEGDFIPYKNANASGLEPIGDNSVQQTINQANQELIDASGYKTNANKANVFGLNQGVLIFSGLLIVGSLTYYFYKNKKK
jgi:hypothetical protein